MKYLFWGLFICLFSCRSIAQTDITINNEFYNRTDAFLGKYVASGKLNYNKLHNNPQELLELLKIMDNAAINLMSPDERKSFYINAYNLTTIKEVILNYPISSPKDLADFFDKKHKIGGEYLSLNEIENKRLRTEFDDPRIHFLLVCAANGCPPLLNRSYRAQDIDNQIETQSKAVINNADFIRVNLQDRKIEASQIFNWYLADFGNSNKQIKAFIDHYHEEDLSSDFKLGFYAYDWSLNESINSELLQNQTFINTPRYFVSSLLSKGHWELKLFNNLYVYRQEGSNSSDINGAYFTSFMQFLYGLNPRLNVGFDLLFKTNRDNQPKASPFKVFELENSGVARYGLSAFGPKVKFTPIARHGNFSIQSSLLFPLLKDPTGARGSRYIDDGWHWWTQLFYDISIHQQLSLFLEADLFLDFDPRFNLDYSKGATLPLKSIVSFFPTNRFTIYQLSEYAISTGTTYMQFGVGLKCLLSPHLEIETLVSQFHSIGGTNREATYNLGIRYTR